MVATGLSFLAGPLLEQFDSPVMRTLGLLLGDLWIVLLVVLLLSAPSGRPLRWQRVNDLPDYTYFNHSIHVRKGVACVSCHGRVDQMPLLAKEHSLYMRWCLDCHRSPEQHKGPASEVFAMKEEPARAARTPPLGQGRGTRLEDL